MLRKIWYNHTQGSWERFDNQIMTLINTNLIWMPSSLGQLDYQRRNRFHRLCYSKPIWIQTFSSCSVESSLKSSTENEVLMILFSHNAYVSIVLKNTKIPALTLHHYITSQFDTDFLSNPGKLVHILRQIKKQDMC